MNENNSFQRQKDPQQASNPATYEQCHFRQVFTVPQCHRKWQWNEVSVLIMHNPGCVAYYWC